MLFPFPFPIPTSPDPPLFPPCGIAPSSSARSARSACRRHKPPLPAHCPSHHRPPDCKSPRQFVWLKPNTPKRIPSTSTHFLIDTVTQWQRLYFFFRSFFLSLPFLRLEISLSKPFTPVVPVTHRGLSRTPRPHYTECLQFLGLFKIFYCLPLHTSPITHLTTSYTQSLPLYTSTLFNFSSRSHGVHRPHHSRR